MMTDLWRFLANKNPGFLSLYILYSLKKKPKSGYAIISELKENGGDNLRPSKGSLYPLLKSLESEGYIKLEKIGARSKNIYGITSKGKKLLSDFRKERKEMNERFFKFQKLLANILGEQKVGIIRLVMEIRKAALEKSDERVIKELNSCLKRINRL